MSIIKSISKGELNEKDYRDFYISYIDTGSFTFSVCVCLQHFLDTKMIGGIRNRYFYLDSSISGYWSTPIYNGINRWYNTSTYFAFAQTTNINYSQIDFYTYENYNSTDNAITLFYLSTNNNAEPGLQDWKFCQIKLNKARLSSTTTDFDSGVVCHELGHACGLNHNDQNQYSIMCNDYIPRLVTNPGTDDVNGINYLYPTGYYNP